MELSSVKTIKHFKPRYFLQTRKILIRDQLIQVQCSTLENIKARVGSYGKHILIKDLNSLKLSCTHQRQMIIMSKKNHFQLC